MRGFDLQPAPGPWREVAVAAALAAAALLVLLQEAGERLRREEHRAWWASNGRDVLNVVGFAAFAGALYLHGYPGPAALLAGGAATLAAYGAWVIAADVARLRHPRLAAIAGGWALSGLLLAFPGHVVGLLVLGARGAAAEVLREGDVVVAVGGEAPASPQGLQRAIASSGTAGPRLTVARDAERLEVALPPR